MHGARYESARRFFHISHAMRNESVRFESTRVYMPGARLEEKKAHDHRYHRRTRSAALSRASNR